MKDPIDSRGEFQDAMKRAEKEKDKPYLNRSTSTIEMLFKLLAAGESTTLTAIDHRKTPQTFLVHKSYHWSKLRCGIISFLIKLLLPYWCMPPAATVTRLR